MPRLLLVYHFFHPDDVAGARQFSDLAREQRRRGWEVDVVTSNRSWRDARARHDAEEEWEGVRIHRVFRPAWDQGRPVQRLGNSGWLLAAFARRAARLPPPDAVVIGSDPAFLAALALPLRRSFPRAALVHWCFDLYPEAIEAEAAGADGAASAASGATSAAVRALAPAARALMARAYARYDLLADLGPRMRRRLAAYGAPAAQETLTPWALAEPQRPALPDPAARAALFPRARLALLYSGTLGRAHDHAAFLALARACRARSGDAISFCFSSRGHRHEALRAAVGPDDTNVSFAPFADEAELERRLAAADLHLASLRPEWAGVVVPSKFFGSLAVGRPVLFAGPRDSEIAAWIDEHDVGLVLNEESGGAVTATADRLHALLADPGAVQRAQAHAFDVYRRHFSKHAINDRWDQTLRRLASRR